MSVSEVADAMTTGRDGVLSWRDRLTIRFALCELLAAVISITLFAGLTSGLLSLGVTSGMFFRPVLPAGGVLAHVRPERGRIDDDADQRRSAAVGEQCRVLAQPVAGPVVLGEDHRVALVDRQQPTGTVVTGIERLGASARKDHQANHRRAEQRRLL